MTSTKPLPPPGQSKQDADQLFFAALMTCWVSQAYMIFAFFWFFGDIGLFKNHHTLFIISVVIISSVLHFWIVLRHWHSRELHKKAQALNTENEAVVRGCCEEKGMSEKGSDQKIPPEKV
jgi:hypothetical protein